MGEDKLRITTTGERYTVEIGRTIDFEDLWDELRRLTGGRHLWVVGMVFALDDPEAALDDVSLGPENLVGTNGFYCMGCGVRYATAIRFSHCKGQETAP